MISPSQEKGDVTIALNNINHCLLNALKKKVGFNFASKGVSYFYE